MRSLRPASPRPTSVRSQPRRLPSPRTARLRRAPALAAGLLSVALAAAGCGTDSAATEASPADPATASGAGFPVVLDNCGTEIEVTEPPQRIVTVKSTATELVLSLGLGEKLVGSAFGDGPLPDALAADGADVPQISEAVPSQEAVLELEPDLVFAGWESVFAADGAGERDSLADFGVATYVAPSACQGEGYKPASLAFEDVFDDILEAGRLFEAQDAAEALVASQQELLDGVDPVGGAPTALWYSSGTDTPYVGAGSGAPAMMMEQLGMENIAADVDDTWTSLGWETIVERDPEVIILVDAQWNTAEDKIARLESNPATAGMQAVESGSYLRLPFAASEAGVRNAEAVADLAEQYGDLDR